MDEGLLADTRILVAEDDYMLAADTARLLREAGATVLGPFATLEQLQERIRTLDIDVAVLDIRLSGEFVFPIADQIMRAGLPIIFLTGYDEETIPPRFAAVPSCQKPCADDMLIEMVRGLRVA